VKIQSLRSYRISTSLRSTSRRSFLHAGLQRTEHAVVGLRGPQAVDAGHRGHDDDVLAVEERAGGGMAHPVDGFVDGGVFFDVEVGLGDVGFRLVIVVVGDEILHRVVREKLLELPVELGRQGLVGGQDQGGQVHLGDDVGHGKGLAGAGDPQEHLVGMSALTPWTSLRMAWGWSPLGVKVTATDSQRTDPLGPVPLR
jgi:hypothetical protein